MLLLLTKAYAASLPGATPACVCQPRGHIVQPLLPLKVSSCARAVLGTYSAHLHWQQPIRSAAAQAVSCDRNPCHSEVRKKSWQTGLLAGARKQSSVSS